MLTTSDKISVTKTDNQIPSIPHILGNINIVITWKNNVLKNEINAETNPLFKAVKNDDANILNQLTKYEIEYNLNALIVIFNSSSS